jgi:phospholipid/cholesterol/gamma-HCH transport system substrate-binding protein
MAVPNAALQSHKSFETIISALVVIIALGFLVFFYLQTGTGRLGSYELRARLPTADGLAVNADVRVGGIKVGSITDMMVAPRSYLAIVRFRIRDDLYLPVDSTLSITIPNMGSPYLTIQPGHSQARVAPDGEFPAPDGVQSEKLRVREKSPR